MDTERDLRLNQRRAGSDIQIISPQNAYIMTSMLKKTVEEGTLYNPSEWGAKFTFRDEQGSRFRMPMAGKTGTPQNWSDAWTVGYSPYYTTAIWFGFDKPGNSLGVNLTGSTLAGPVWADFMREIHQGLPFKDFTRPSTGIIDVTVCTKSGLLTTPGCPSSVTLPFLEGTQPTRFCDMHGSGTQASSMQVLGSMRFDAMLIDDSALLGELKMPELQLDLLPEIQKMQEEVSQSRYRQSTNSRQTTTATTTLLNRQRIGRRNPAPSDTSSTAGNAAVPAYNPILDGDLFNTEEIPTVPVVRPVQQAPLNPVQESGSTPVKPPPGDAGSDGWPADSDDTPVPQTGYTPALPPPDPDNPADVPETNDTGKNDKGDNEFGLILPDYNPLLD
jgi:penicillin-binding protein 1A